MVAAGVLLIPGAQVHNLMDGERLAGRAFGLVSPRALRTAEMLQDVGRGMAVNGHGARDAFRGFSQASILGFEFAQAHAQPIDFGDTDLRGVHPGVEFVGYGEDIRRLLAARPADRKSKFQFPPLHCSDATAEVGGNLFPSVQDIGFSHCLYFTPERPKTLSGSPICRS